MKEKLVKIIPLIVLIIILIAIINKDRINNDDTKIDFTSPFHTDIIEELLISGSLHPAKEVSVNSTVSGVLDKYFVKIGEIVKEGDKIAIVRPLPNPSELDNSNKNLLLTQINYKNARVNYERNKQLYSKKVISLEDYEKSIKELEICETAYNSANNQHQLLENGFSSSILISNIVTASIDGVVEDLPLEEGETVVERNNFREGTSIATISQKDSFLFKADVVEVDLIKLSHGMEVETTPLSNPEFKSIGKIRYISPKGHMINGLLRYSIEAMLHIPDSIKVYSGFTANGKIIIKERHNVLAVKENDVTVVEDSVYVRVLNEDGNVSKKIIKIGASDGKNVEILHGLDSLSKIITKK
jgi:HlyD family secretion protein